MTYATPDEVFEIMNNCPLTVDQIGPYLTSSHLVVDEILGGSGLSAFKLKDIEKYLTAHLIASVHTPPASREKVGEVEVEYSTAKFGIGLQSTSYGQIVSLLDTTGKLSSLGKRAASFFVPKSFDE